MNVVATTPLWIWTVDRFSSHESTIADWPAVPSQHRLPFLPELIVFELCIAANAVAHSLGLLVRRWRSGVADAILAWFTRPFVLFYALVFSTLGVYINMYAFGVDVLPRLILVAFGPPTIGYLSGGLLAVVARLPTTVDRVHVAIESSVLNCALASTMIRLGVQSDVDADTFAATTMLVTCATPATLVGTSLVRRLMCSASGQIVDDGPTMTTSRSPGLVLNRDPIGRVAPEKNLDLPSMPAERHSVLSKSRSQMTQADELEISVIIVDEKITVM